MKKHSVIFLLVGFFLLTGCSREQTKVEIETRDEKKDSTHETIGRQEKNRPDEKVQQPSVAEEQSLEADNLELFDLHDVKKIKLSYTGFNISLKTTDEAQLKVDLTSHEDHKTDEETNKQTASMLELNRRNTTKDKKKLTIYLPKSYEGLLLLDLHNADLESKEQLKFKDFKLWTDNSNVRFNNLEAQEADLVLANSNLETSSIISQKLNIEVQKGSLQTTTLEGEYLTANISNGNLIAKKVRGKIDLATRRGSIKLGDIEGAAKFVTEQGTIIGNFKKINDNLELISHRGDIKLFIPREIGFNLKGVAEKGTIETDFNDQLEIKDSHYQGAVGPKSSIEIVAQVNEGGIELKRH